MKHLSLASRYRPQTFAEVIGQELVTTALSRAASENRIAPAYLLSGTRGVGKTTIARIFAKALNCEKGPAAEPCNVCRQCIQITTGAHVDVNEIDGASNTGVDDVRALREKIGFLPMEGKYKIFIVDEAHMLSKSAFNALLKTLEEPPPHTVFIFATTEAHRFPATIISRCQHFVFRHLPEDAIIRHLDNILKKEGVSHDDVALRLIAARAAGSVRDSMSLLDQVLALCDGKLDKATARKSLGLAGQEFFSELFAAISSGSCAKVLELCSSLLHSGVDIGFFLRELATYLRNLFLFAQSGDAILPQLSLPPDEIAFLKRHSASFSPAHLHAAWQMTLESQSGITHNPEPGSALELLLINLALLPRLLPVINLPGSSAPAPSSGTPPPAGTLAEAESHAYATIRQNNPGTSGISERVSETSENMAPSWNGFCEFCEKEQAQGKETITKDILRQVTAHWTGDRLELAPAATTLWKRLEDRKAILISALGRYCRDKAPEVILRKPEDYLNPEELRAELSNRPEMILCRQILDATITECSQKPVIP